MKSRFSIPWADLSPLLDGTNAIDTPRLEIRSLRDAGDFLESYGYNWDAFEDQQELETLRKEALEFIQQDLLFDEPQLSIPEEIYTEQDVRKLLLWSSDMTQPERQRWAWVVFRVMHTFSHSNSYFDDKYGTAIREQILGRFRPHVFSDGDAISLGTGPGAVSLSNFDIRRRKARRSAALKLLHKRGPGGAEIFDWVGVRMVTYDRYDALRVVRYLREHNVINFMQLQPGRTRNTLLDVDRIQEEILELNELARAGKLPDYKIESTLRERVNAHPYPSPPEKSYNPNSSLAYHSIQFTCMQRIRVQDRENAAITRFLDRLPMRDTPMMRLLRTYADRLDTDGAARFLFPFELQILDQHSYELSRSGLAAHHVYKERQRQRVKERLLGPKMRTAAE